MLTCIESLISEKINNHNIIKKERPYILFGTNMPGVVILLSFLFTEYFIFNFLLDVSEDKMVL